MTALDVKLRILNCTDCELHERVTAPVHFSGESPNPFAVIGEAPGSVEDQQGRPFVGPSGQLLRRAINIAFGEEGYAETFSYLNVVCCWPNRTPNQTEIKACHNNLSEQLGIIQPKYAIVCGGVALNALHPRATKPLSVSSYRGTWISVGQVMCLPTWHPSAVLRDGGIGTSKGQQLIEDLALFADVILFKNLAAAREQAKVEMHRDET